MSKWRRSAVLHIPQIEISQSVVRRKIRSTVSNIVYPTAEHEKREKCSVSRFQALSALNVKKGWTFGCSGHELVCQDITKCAGLRETTMLATKDDHTQRRFDSRTIENSQQYFLNLASGGDELSYQYRMTSRAEIKAALRFWKSLSAVANFLLSCRR